MQCHHNMVSFLQNPDNRHPIARPWGWGMGCLLWILIPIYVLPQLLECCMWYPVVLDRVTTALNCTRLYLDRTQRDIILTISITFIHMLHLPVTFRVASMALRQVHDFLSISYVVVSVLGSHAVSWWRHEMESVYALLALCVGNSVQIYVTIWLH